MSRSSPPPAPSRDAPHDPFQDPQAVARYAQGPARIVPGWADMLRMSTLLLAEQVPEHGHVLVLGAGGGLELRQFAQAQPGWTFCGVDPSGPMLALARQTLGPLIERVQLHQGLIADAPETLADGASCLLTLHFVPEPQRLELLRELRRRLRPGAPLVLAHLSFSQADGERARWLQRYAAFVASSGVAPEQAQAAAEAVGERLCVLAPEREEALLREAGFAAPELFYAGLAFRGWVCRA